MFGKPKDKDMIAIDGVVYLVDPAVARHIETLRHELKDAKHDKASLERELELIKPIVKDSDFKPALSEDCLNCDFVIKSPWNGYALGCIKHNVCDDFKRRKE